MRARKRASRSRGDGPEGDGRATVPAHVAVIMDGNGRWAQRRGLKRIQGHRAGAEAIREIVRACGEIEQVRVLSLYAFSAENWSRPRTEITGLFKLLKLFLKKETPELIEQGVTLRAIGRLDEFPADVREAVRVAEGRTAGGETLTLCLALNYGSQDELVDAARSLALRARDGMIEPDAIGREDLEGCLYTAGLPPVDLLIRTGGDLRVSNFLLWQLSYAELYFTSVCWPAFGRKHLAEAFREFAKRQRRFGGL